MDSGPVGGGDAMERARVPYGPPIRDAIATGDVNHMRQVLASVRPAIDELEAAIANLEKRDVRSGPIAPYGPPIRDATARGDLAEMRAVAGAARAALEGIHFAPVSESNAREVKAALAELDAAIAELGG